jgi:hypothetical protein
VHRELRAYGRTPDLAGSEIRRGAFSHPPLIGQRVAHAGNKLEAVDVLLLRRVRRWLLAKGTSCCGNKCLRAAACRRLGPEARALYATKPRRLMLRKARPVPRSLSRRVRRPNSKPSSVKFSIFRPIEGRPLRSEPPGI